MSKELSKEEIRDIFLEQIIRSIDENTNSDEPTEKKLYALAFSILAMIDGMRGYIKNWVPVNIPLFILAPCPYKEDREYNIDRGEDYYPDNDDTKILCNISGELHDYFSEYMHDKNNPQK